MKFTIIAAILYSILSCTAAFAVPPRLIYTCSKQGVEYIFIFGDHNISGLSVSYDKNGKVVRCEP
jgi:hypothetical protein